MQTNESLVASAQILSTAKLNGKGDEAHMVGS
jgi:hypothetical protein